MSGVAVRAADWPHGLKCGQCRRILADGDRYAERLMSMAGNIPVVMIVCVECDTVGMSDTFREALQGVAGDSWADDLARASVCAADAKFGHPGHDVCPSCGRCRDCGGQHQADCPGR